MKALTNKLTLAGTTIRNRIQKLMKDTRGSSEFVAVIGLIIVAVVILTVIFFPQIKEWFSSVMTSLGTSTTNLFKLT